MFEKAKQLISNLPIRVIKYLKLTAAFSLVISMIFLGLGSGYVSALTKKEGILSKEEYNQKLDGWSQTSYAYFRSVNNQYPRMIGAMISASDRRLLKNLNEVSPHLVNAFLSIEDRDFYNHNGIHMRSIIRAGYQHFLNDEDEMRSGGSTITQQLVKNKIIANSDRTIERKVKEMINAIRVERFYNKDDIFVAYLNSLEFGRGANGKLMYGVTACAKGMFNKRPDNLTISEAAYIAGMVQRPYSYNPFVKDTERNLRRGTERMKLVLKQMLKYDKITEEQYEQAVNLDIKSVLAKRENFTNVLEKYPYIIWAVEREAIQILQAQDKKKGINKDKTYQEYRNEITQGGYHLYTTVDEVMYTQMNNAIKNFHFPERTFRLSGKKIKQQAGAVMLDNKSGAVLSFVSGADYSQTEEDHAFKATNQPGSTIKPILAYGPALNEGIISPESIVIDEPIAKIGGSGLYQNYKNNYIGAKPVSYHLKYSTNPPAIKVFRKVGIERGFNYLRKMDMQPHPYDGESSALGGFTNGFTVAQMTASFATLGNSGVYNKPYLIERIIGPNGKELFHHTNGSKRIFSPPATSELNKMLRSVVVSGTASRIGRHHPGYNIAGKTGTSQKEYDLWFVGYTPDIAMGVWTGYDYNLPVYNHLAALNIWSKLFAVSAPNSNLITKKNFPLSGRVPYRCFECHLVPKEPKQNEDKKKVEDKKQQDDKQDGNEAQNNLRPDEIRSQ